MTTALELFKEYISTQAKLSAPELERVMAIAFTKKLRRKNLILRQGEVCRYDCFVSKGCLRTYRVDEQGHEHILRFAVENWWISDRESITTGTPSKLNIEALEDSEVVFLRHTEFERLMDAIPALKNFHGNLISRSLVSSTKRIYNNISASAEEKYEQFIETYPDVFRRVPIHMIASYLGLSRKTLTRIRMQYAHS